MMSTHQSEREGGSFTQEVRLGTLPKSVRSQAIKLLTDAFIDDPLMAFIMEDLASHGLRKRGLGAIMDYSLAIREHLGWPIFSAWEGENLAGLGLCSLPEKQAWPQWLVDQIDQTKLILGTKATQRLEAYGEIVANARPEEPHIFLGVLGVDPSAQGHGFGRKLLNKVQDFSDHFPGSKGVFLDTAGESNVAFYEHCGYQIVGHHAMDTIDIWCLFRSS